MKTLVKLALGAAMIGGLAVADIAPASAGVAVGVSVGGPGPHARWCWRHPHACGRPAGYVAVGGPRIGVFYGGRGWWDGHRYWAHRERFHGGWRFR